MCGARTRFSEMLYDTTNYKINIQRNVMQALRDKHSRMQGEKQDLHTDGAAFYIFNDLAPLPPTSEATSHR
jgi:hypothetical protein